MFSGFSREPCNLYAGSRVGEGGTSVDPYLLGSFFEGQNQNLVAGQSGHGECSSAWSTEVTPSPARRGETKKWVLRDGVECRSP
jgi:hypothetical protein